ncbi:MAG: hypothetical protein IH899_06605 [Planctomycetes bacterium]|nr:hypothetical protein [Planctomycetota bacterium]
MEWSTPLPKTLKELSTNHQEHQQKFLKNHTGWFAEQTVCGDSAVEDFGW